jgi:signal transduction histidine kinase
LAASPDPIQNRDVNLAVRIGELLNRATFTDIDADIEQCLRLVGIDLELTIVAIARRERHRLLTENQFRTNGYMDPAFELDLRQASWWRGHLDESEDVVIDAIDDLPEAASHEREVLAERSTGSLVAIALGCGTERYLIAEVLWKPRRWSAEELRALGEIAHHFGGALARHREHQELLSEAREATRANREKTQFIATLAHELRTPLTAIIGYGQLLATEALGELTFKQRQFVEDILSCAEHLDRIVKESLDLTKLEAGRMSLEVSEIDARSVVRAAALQVQPRAEAKGLDLIIELPDQPVSMSGDELKLRQVLINLLTNAVKFTRQGTVTAALRSSDDAVEIDVRDTGIGIAPANLERIFDSFARVHRDRGDDEGTGLGLALVRRMLELHHGEISVTSELGAGSCFTITLPRRTLGAIAGRPAYVQRVI